MSATMNADRFAKYFSIPVGLELAQAQIIHIEGKMHDVREHWIENLRQLAPHGEVCPALLLL